MNQSLEKSQAHITIHGRVQGVFFRANTVKKAQEIGLTGWVKNQPDGTVEALVQGPAAKVEELIVFWQKNPGSCKVQDIDIKWEKPVPVLKSFEKIKNY